MNLLLAVLVVSAIATATAGLLPSPPNAVAIGLDAVPPFAVVVATVVFALRVKRLSAPAGRRVAAVCVWFAGTLIGISGVAHSVAILAQSFERWREQQFVYGFRLYSLLLLGALLVGTGAVAAIRAERLAHGGAAAWRESLFVWLLILAINLPLAPLQTFAVGFTIVAIVTLLLLAAVRQRMVTHPPVPEIDAAVENAHS